MSRAVEVEGGESRIWSKLVIVKLVAGRLYLRIDPYGSLETDGKSPLEDKKHSSGTDTRRCGDGRGMLDLIDQSSLDSHDDCHNTDHGKKLAKVSNRFVVAHDRDLPKADGRCDQSGTKGWEKR